MISDNIRKYRKENNMSQDELAEKLGVSRQSVSLWENGQTQPTIDNIIALAKIFNISTDTILENTGGAKPPEEKAPEIKKKRKVWPLILILLLCLAAAGAALYFTVFDKMINGGKPDNVAAVNSAEQSQTAETTSVAAASSEPSAATSSAKSGAQKTSSTSSKKSNTSSKKTGTTTSAASSKPQEVKQFDLFSYCRDFAVQIGNLNGDYCIYQQPATRYGGYDGEYFSVSYWGDSNMVEFCLHCPLSETQSVNFYLRMRGGYNKKYEYLSSKYYRDTGESFRDATGYIDPAVFSDRYPLSCDKYNGDIEGQNDFMEESRVGICDLIHCLKNFVEVENMECDFSAFDFVNF